LDPGLQPQRTALAWGRTGLAVFVNAFLVLRLGEQSGRTLTIALGIFLLAAAAGIIGVGISRSRALAQTPAPPGPPAAMLIAMVVVVWIACIAGAMSILATAAFG
jgi:hypothetical protein